MPGPTSPDGGVLVGGAANYIVNQSAPEKQAAAYEFAKYLASPKMQSEWAAATGYVPVSKSAATMSPLAREVRAAARVQGRVRPAPRPARRTTRPPGPVIGAYGGQGEGVRGAVIDAVQSMLTNGTIRRSRRSQTAAKNSNTAIEDYNIAVLRWRTSATE